MGSKGIVASTAALAVLLQEGIGDTIRVSLTPHAQRRPHRGGASCRSRSCNRSASATSRPQVTACPGCGRTTSTFFQEMADQIQTYLREQMPVWKAQHPGVETLKVAVMGCIVNGPGESKHANIGISLPGTFEEPKAPVYVDGRLHDHAQGRRGSSRSSSASSRTTWRRDTDVGLGCWVVLGVALTGRRVAAAGAGDRHQARDPAAGAAERHHGRGGRARGPRHADRRRERSHGRDGDPAARRQPVPGKGARGDSRRQRLRQAGRLHAGGGAGRDRDAHRPHQHAERMARGRGAGGVHAGAAGQREGGVGEPGGGRDQRRRAERYPRASTCEKRHVLEAIRNARGRRRSRRRGGRGHGHAGVRLQGRHRHVVARDAGEAHGGRAGAIELRRRAHHGRRAGGARTWPLPHEGRNRRRLAHDDRGHRRAARRAPAQAPRPPRHAGNGAHGFAFDARQRRLRDRVFRPRAAPRRWPTTRSRRCSRPWSKPPRRPSTTRCSRP